MKHEHTLRRADETILERIGRFTVIGLMGIFMILALIGNISAQADSGIRAFAAIILTAGFLWVFTSFATKTVTAYKMWLTIIFVIALLLRIVMINTWPIEPTSDFKDTYKVALAIANSDTSDIALLMRTDFRYYFTTWAVHVPFILVETFIIKIFGEGYYPVQIFFNIFSALSCVMSAMIAKCLYGRRAGIIAGLMMCVFPLGLMYSAVLSNQHIATFFFLLSIYVLISNPFKARLANIALSSACMTVSQLVRPEMLVFIIAVICYFMYRDILSIRRKRKIKPAWKKFTGYCVMFLSVYLVLLFTVSMMLVEGGFVQKGITHTNYKYKIATGLNLQSEGRWSEHDAAYSDNEEMLDILIGERLKDKGQVTKLMFSKLMYQYGSYDYQWCIDGKEGRFIEKWYGPLTNGVMFVVLLLCLAKTIIDIRKKSRRELFLMIIMVGYFMVFTVIEVQNRYNYFAIPIFMIMGSGTLIYIYENGKEYVNKLIEKYREKKLEDI